MANPIIDMIIIQDQTHYHKSDQYVGLILAFFWPCQFGCAVKQMFWEYEKPPTPLKFSNSFLPGGFLILTNNN